MLALVLLGQLSGLTTDDLPSPSLEDPVNGLGGFVWVLFLLAVLVAAGYYFTRVMGRRMGAGMSLGAMRVVDRLAVAQNKSILLVRVGERCYMIGVTPSQLTTLGELMSDELPDAPQQGAPVPDRMASFLSGLVNKNRDGTRGDGASFAEHYKRSTEDYTFDYGEKDDEKDGKGQ